jgi:hypothetical protein
MKSSNKALIGGLIVLGLVVIAVGAFKFSHFGIEGRDGEGKGIGCPFAKSAEQLVGNKYDGAAYSVQYPTGYTFVAATKDYKIATIKNLKGEKVVEIYKATDFIGGVVVGFWGDEDEHVKAQTIVTTLEILNDNVKYGVNLAYPKNDAKAKAVAYAIYNSIKLK